MKRTLLATLAITLLATSCAWQSGTLEVEAPPIALSSFIYDKDGNQITTFRGEQHRVNVESLDEIPRILINAVVAIEDERFWQHSGMDLRAILRAALSNINEGGISEGGSTITQQYVGLAFLDRTDQSVGRKIDELALARQFENQYTKEFILKEYLNLVYFGEGAYGVIAAADEYFNKTLADLTISETAILAGLIQAPATYNPYENLDAALLRRKQVLDRMLINNHITEKEYDQARTEPVRLAPRVEVLEETYEAPYFVEDVRQWILDDPRFGETRRDRSTLLFEGGLRIYTTVDLSLQRKAEQAVREILAEEDASSSTEKPTAAVVVIENDTGYVRAIVGGEDFFGDTQSARFNLATQGGRHAGSAFKPLVLAAALEQGIQLATQYPAPDEIEIPNPPLPEPWEVEGGRGGGTISLEEATIRSTNTVFAQLMEDITPKVGVEMARRLGVQSHLNDFLSAVLGTNDVTVLDMATAFSTIARRGILVRPTLVSKIIGPGGEIIYEHPLESNKVLDSNIADQITDTLRKAVANGTGWRAQLPGIEAAGKTGTAENFKDATFSGFTSKYTTSVWVGFPREQIEMEPPRTLIEVYGGTYPARIWQGVMSAAHEADIAAASSSTETGSGVRPLPRPVPTSTTIPENPMTAVPDFFGMTETQVRERAAETHLTPIVTYRYLTNEDISENSLQVARVATQIPEPDEIVDFQAPVWIDIITNNPALEDQPSPYNEIITPDTSANRPSSNLAPRNPLLDSEEPLSQEDTTNLLQDLGIITLGESQEG